MPLTIGVPDTDGTLTIPDGGDAGPGPRRRHHCGLRLEHHHHPMVLNAEPITIDIDGTPVDLTRPQAALLAADIMRACRQHPARRKACAVD